MGFTTQHTQHSPSEPRPLDALNRTVHAIVLALASRTSDQAEASKAVAARLERLAAELTGRGGGSRPPHPASPALPARLLPRQTDAHDRGRDLPSDEEIIETAVRQIIRRGRESGGSPVEARQAAEHALVDALAAVAASRASSQKELLKRIQIMEHSLGAMARRRYLTAVNRSVRVITGGVQ